MAYLLEQVPIFILVILWHLFVCEFAWHGLSLICISIYYLINHLFHIILTMALSVGFNSWKYQQTLLKYGVLFLIHCYMFYLVSMTLYISTHRENISLYSLSLDNWYSHFMVEYFCSSSYWLLRWIALFIAKCFVFTPIACLASCMDPIFQLVVFSIVNKIWRVMIPCACILYSNINIKDNAWILGKHSFLFRTLSYLSIFDPFISHLISILCVYGRQIFFFWCFVPSWKV